jgi:hypothetical protein
MLSERPRNGGGLLIDETLAPREWVPPNRCFGRFAQRSRRRLGVSRYIYAPLAAAEETMLER